MATRLGLFLINAILVNICLLVSFLIRYGKDIPERNFLAYKNSFIFITIIIISALSACGVYGKRFKSSWDLFKKVFSGLSFGFMLSIFFIYIFRVKWGAFPTSIFIFSFALSLIVIFKANQYVLKAGKKIRKKVVVVGEGNIEDIEITKADVEYKRINPINALTECSDADEIIICDKIDNQKDINLLIYLVQNIRARVVFSPSVYMDLLPEKINGNNHIDFLSTFIGKKRDIEEFFIRAFDVAGSIAILIICLPIIIFIAFLIKITSLGPIIYKQKRVGKDGRIFTLYKFRTMIENAEKLSGPIMAVKEDPRTTTIGKILRQSRFDEFPQLFNIIKGDMSLVGPRPERLHFVKLHKALRGLRLAVRPGLTGLAQIRSFYDLHPKHKIKYDYLYIQKRSLLLNVYILAKTVPAVFTKKGW